MTYCLNCGHESHCGVEYRKDAHNGRGEFLGQIVVCKHCRCELCDDRERTLAWARSIGEKNGWYGLCKRRV